MYTNERAKNDPHILLESSEHPPSVPMPFHYVFIITLAPLPHFLVTIYCPINIPNFPLCPFNISHYPQDVWQEPNIIKPCHNIPTFNPL